MSFSQSWLALREAYDRAATARAPLAALRAALAGRKSLRAVDLGAGTGATIRMLAPLLAVPQHWFAVERDAALAAAGKRQLATDWLPGVRVEWRQIDLAAPDGLARAVPEGTDLVTASAFLDLVSRPWLEALAGLPAVRQALLWSRLTVDGRVAFDPPDPLDGWILRLFRAHQRTDKGFGPALGPTAPKVLRRLLAPLPGRIVEGPADWQLGPADMALQQVLIAGFAAAATAMAPSGAAAIAAWQERRRAQLAQGGAQLLVGHRDLVWIPDGFVRAAAFASC